MEYKLDLEEKDEKVGAIKALRSISPYLNGMWKSLALAMVFVLVNSTINVVVPFIIGDVSKKYIPVGDKEGLLLVCAGLFAMYIVEALTTYLQIFVMGRVGQKVIFRLRNAIFNTVQMLPLQFFNSNKSGDLISRINSDTDKLSQAFSETLLRFIGNIFVILGIGVAMIILNPVLGFISLFITIVLTVITLICGQWINTKNKESLKAFGQLSGEIQESLSNFKVTVAFNRRDYFRESFYKSNSNNRNAATWAGIANGILQPFYDYAGALAMLLVYVIGVHLIANGQIEIFGIVVKSDLEFGTLISFILYVNGFYQPLRIMASLFASIQTSLAAWTRISKLLNLKTNLVKVEDLEVHKKHETTLMEFKEVSFGYTQEKMVLKNLNFEIEKGKTYALVGPTGGGKSTTASLFARLYDVTEGSILLEGKDIRSYEPSELAKIVGFILQEPYLFSGTLGENIKYGNESIIELSDEELEKKLTDLGLAKLVERFEEGLKTPISNNAENISLGQKQLIAFVRILLREPKLLILDEATANIDTVTEQLLEEIIEKLPEETTKIIIAHRLNTIENADQIFFISNGTIEKPVDFKSAMGLIENTKSKS